MPEVRFASFSRRLIAALLDSAVWVIGILWLLGSLPVSFYRDDQLAAGILVLLLLSAWFNYFAICEWRFGQTIGKNAFGLRVVPVAAGAELTYNAAALRNLLRLVDLPLALIGVDWLIVDRSPRKQRLGDRVADTVVLREPEVQAAAPPPRPAPAPTSAELFGDAAAALAEVQPPAPGMGSDAAAAAPPLAGAPPEPASAGSAGGGASASGFPYSNWGPKVAIGGVVVAILSGIVLGIPAVIIDNPPSSGELGTGANIFVQLATVIGFLVVPIVVAGRRGGGGLGPVLRRLGVRGFRPSALKWMAAAAAIYIAFAALYANLITQPKQDDIASSFGPVWIQVVLIVGLAAVSEELCFRGMLFSGIRERLPGLAAALLSGAIFGALHLFTGITAVPPLIVFGTVLALLYERTGSIVPSMILHALNNALALLAQ